MNDSIQSFSDAAEGNDFKPMERVSLVNMLMVVPLYKMLSTKYCRIIMEDQQLMSTMLEKQYDLVIIDGLWYFRCLYIIPHRLHVPFITLTGILDPLAAGVSSSPAVEPSQLLELTKKCRFMRDYQISVCR